MSAFSIPPCLIGSFCEGQADTRRCHTQAYTISLEAYNISILYGRTKETFTTCFELQGLSALLDIHMKIITSFERDFLARGNIPVTREYQPLLSRKQHQTPVWNGHHRITLEKNATYHCSSRRIAILRDHVKAWSHTIGTTTRPPHLLPRFGRNISTPWRAFNLLRQPSCSDTRFILNSSH